MRAGNFALVDTRSLYVSIRVPECFAGQFTTGAVGKCFRLFSTRVSLRFFYALNAFHYLFVFWRLSVGHKPYFSCMSQSGFPLEFPRSSLLRCPVLYFFPYRVSRAFFLSSLLRCLIFKTHYTLLHFLCIFFPSSVPSRVPSRSVS